MGFKLFAFGTGTGTEGDPGMGESWCLIWIPPNDDAPRMTSRIATREIATKLASLQRQKGHDVIRHLFNNGTDLCLRALAQTRGEIVTATISFLLAMVTTVIAGLRIVGVTHIAYQAVAHLFVGGLIGAWLGSRRLDYRADPPDPVRKDGYLWLAAFLIVVEVVCFVWFKMHCRVV